MMESWWWGLHMLAFSLFWIGIVALGVMAMRRLTTSRRAGGAGESTSSANVILQERYARGEIGCDEYMEKQRDLRASTAP
jgi:putative membrane protein